MGKITPFLWFDNNAEEAIEFYTSIFKNSRILDVSRYPEGAPAPAGTVMTATVELEGQTLMLLNGGPHFKLTEAFSLMVSCETQEEVDELWEKLSAGGEESQCGWLKDKFGLSWQITPTALMELMGDPDPVKSRRVMEAMLKMKKIDIAAIQRAHDQPA
jgi:predicted 3-demethylubiquinone-9 3-methyltransferase (glyoxalase superfamily)